MPDETRVRDLVDDMIEDVGDEEYSGLREYDIISTPNDFNIKTIFDFIKSGAVKIPGFQRNYVWDIKRASKLVESILIGLPIPQVFLYEEARNKFLVVDGQQRLLSIFYFIKGRFPKPNHRPMLREIFNEKNDIPDDVLADDEFFRDFQLQLPHYESGEANPLHGLSYVTLGDLQTTLDLKPIRNIIIKQTRPEDDDSSIYEIFNRLNSGGVNLKPQEIRMALYHSPFYAMLGRLNADGRWRRLIGIAEPDLHLKDMEILVRSYAMLVEGAVYKPTLLQFVNRFSKASKGFDAAKVGLLKQIGEAFFERSLSLEEKAFFNKKTNRFNVPMFEAAFAAACEKALEQQRAELVRIDTQYLDRLQRDVEFIAATQLHTTGSAKVQTRLSRAKAAFSEA